MTVSKHKDTAVFGRILATWGGPNTALFSYKGEKEGGFFYSAVSVSTRLDQSLRLL